MVEGYGGAGSDPIQVHILTKKPSPPVRRDCRPRSSMVGPVIIHFGDDYQKSRFAEDFIWGNLVPGFQTGSGSDLASLKTRAERNEKVYHQRSENLTTQRNIADWMFCLVRTNWDAKQQEGISSC